MYFRCGRARICRTYEPLRTLSVATTSHCTTTICLCHAEFLGSKCATEAWRALVRRTRHVLPPFGHRTHPLREAPGAALLRVSPCPHRTHTANTANTANTVKRDDKGTQPPPPLRPPSPSPDMNVKARAEPGPCCETARLLVFI